MMSLVHSEIVHAMITIVSLYLFLLFGWWAGRQWWLQMEPVSKIFLFTGFLMLGIAFSQWRRMVRVLHQSQLRFSHGR